MREPERIDRILGYIEKIWKENPDLRLGQLILNAMSDSNALYHFEDDKMENHLACSYHQYKCEECDFRFKCWTEREGFKPPLRHGKDHKTMEKERYWVDFYDMMDGWIHIAEHDSTKRFNSLEEAKALAIQLQSELHENNKKAGEHWGVIDTQKGFIEIFCQDESPPIDLAGTIKSLFDK